MRHFSPSLLLLAVALSASPALSQCSEPSALDLDAAATPLRVEKSGSRDLRLSWESVTADGYRLHRGGLDRLHAEGVYDHRVVEEAVDPELVRRDGDGSSYFLVNSHCRNGSSGVGRDSFDVERPWGGLFVVAIGLEGGAGVNGSQFTLVYPPDQAFTDADGDGVTFLGPYAQGAPGNPFGAVNATDPGLVRVAVVFGSIAPDPSFDPPLGMPIEITEVFFGYHGAAPVVGDFTLEDCRVSDSLGNNIPAVSCVITRFDILY